MTFTEFHDLTLAQRSDAVWEWGFFIGKCKAEDVNKVLYSLNGYFAEMIIRISDNEIVDVRPLQKLEDQLERSYTIERNNPFIKSALFADQPN